ILGYIYMYICYKAKNKDEKAGQRYTYNKSCVKEILRISIPITLSAAVMSGSNLIDLSLIMRNLLGLGYTEETATAIYGNYTTLAVPMFNLAISLISPISIAFVPIFSKCAAEKKQGLLTEAAYTSLSLINCLSVPMSLGLFVYAEPILRLLFKGSDIILGTQLLKLLTPAIIFMGMLTVTNSLLESLGEVRVPVYSMLLGSVLKIICTLILIKNPLYGIKAAPIGTVLCYAVALIFSLYSLGRKTKIFVPVLRKTLLPFANTLTALLLTKPLFTRLSELIGETVSLFIIIVIIALIYIALTFICTVLFDKKILKLAKYTNFA
ncbi:MAG: polysaccharide biosynthesis C-terminal domain-containing protein, partial [Clostridia bacterium]|nr:polysaccharide biosynthesis C-terminal domain-containing protein [Clostridia bacterium]